MALIRSTKRSTKKTADAKIKKPPNWEVFYLAVKDYLEPLIPACNNNAPKPPIFRS